VVLPELPPVVRPIGLELVFLRVNLELVLQVGDQTVEGPDFLIPLVEDPFSHELSFLLISLVEFLGERLDIPLHLLLLLVLEAEARVRSPELVLVEVFQTGLLHNPPLKGPDFVSRVLLTVLTLTPFLDFFVQSNRYLLVHVLLHLVVASALRQEKPRAGGPFQVIQVIVLVPVQNFDIIVLVQPKKGDLALRSDLAGLLNKVLTLRLKADRVVVR